MTLIVQSVNCLFRMTSSKWPYKSLFISSKLPVKRVKGPYDLSEEILSVTHNKVEQSWYVTRQFQTRTGFWRLNDDLSCDFKSIISVGRSGLSDEINIRRLNDFGIFVKSIGAFYRILDTLSSVTPTRIAKKFRWSESTPELDSKLQSFAVQVLQ